MRETIIAVLLLCAAGAGAADKTPPPDAPPHDPSKPPARDGFTPPAQTIPQTVKTAPLNEGTGKPVVRSDAEIGRALEKSLMDDPSAPRVEGLAISIADGKVVIRGKVRTQADKDRVTAKAGAAAGLRNVANELEVRAP